MSGNARQDSSHSASNSLLESFEKWQLLLIERRVLRHGKKLCWESTVSATRWRCFRRGACRWESARGLGIEVCEVCQLVGELMAQPWVGENLSVAVAFAALHERCNE